MSKLNFLLIRSGKYEENKESLFFSAVSHPPLGLLYLAASLEKKNHHVTIIDYYIDKHANEKLQKCLEKMDAVGISVYTVNFKDACKIAKTIRLLDPTIPIILGGPHCIYLQQKALQEISQADIVVSCEGEQVILDIAEWLQGFKILSNIPGIYYRNKNEIKTGKPIETIKDLDKINFPARHLVDKYDYGDVPGAKLLRKKVTAMITSRGCPFHCRFCTRYSNVIADWGYRMRSAENIIDELFTLEGEYKTIFVVDDNFLANTKRAHKIFDDILEYGLNFDMYVEGARVETADSELYKKMKKAGVQSIAFGIESGNQDVLDFYNKKITLPQIRSAVKLGHKAGLITYATFILGAPIESKDHFNKTIDFACSLPLDIAVFGILGYTMGSQLWNEAVKDKKINKDEYRVLSDSNRNLGSIPLDEIKQHIEIAYKRFYFRPSYIIKQAFRSIKRGRYHIISDGPAILQEIATFSKNIG